jgi:hypothetical protein
MTATMPLPGDAILYPAGPRSELTARIVAAGEELAGMGKGFEGYSHAAIMAQEQGWQWEAKFPLTGRYLIDTSRVYEVWRLGNPTPDQRLKALKWCRQNKNRLYDLLGVLTFGRLRMPGTFYCSEFACMAYAAAGLHPGDKIMSPNSLPEYPGAQMIYRYKPPRGRHV